MSKTFTPVLTAAYLLGTRKLSHAILIERSDGQSFAFTSAQTPALINGVKYESSGLQLTDVVTTLDMSVGNLELSTIDDGSVFSRAEIFGKLWDNARFQIFEYSRLDPDGGKNAIVSGTFGEIALPRGMIVVELRDLMQYLQQPIGEVSSKNCRNRLGDERCGVDLGPFTETGTLTSVSSNQVFRDSARTEDEDWFGEGIFTFTSGNCAGFSQKVKTYNVDGTFTISLPMFSAVEVGDTYEVVAGCRKRHDRTLANPAGVSDCMDKFNNVLNLRAEPHRPGIDEITSEPEPAV